MLARVLQVQRHGAAVSIACLQLVLLICAGCSSAHPAPANTDTQPNLPALRVAASEPGQVDAAVDTLRKVTEFCTARVGRTQVPTEATKAFAVILHQPEAASLFQELASAPGLPTRLYGLCGLWITDRDAYEAAAPALLETHDDVTFYHGCVFMTVPASKVVRSSNPEGTHDIESGIIPGEFRAFAVSQQ